MLMSWSQQDNDEIADTRVLRKPSGVSQIVTRLVYVSHRVALPHKSVLQSWQVLASGELCGKRKNWRL